MERIAHAWREVLSLFIGALSLSVPALVILLARRVVAEGMGSPPKPDGWALAIAGIASVVSYVVVARATRHGPALPLTLSRATTVGVFVLRFTLSAWLLPTSTIVFMSLAPHGAALWALAAAALGVLALGLIALLFLTRGAEKARPG
jgi:hypothetical protein